MGSNNSNNLFQENKKKATQYLERFKVNGVLNHINGSKVESANAKTFETISPIDLKHLSKVSLGGSIDIDKAAKAAKGAFREWADIELSLIHI